MGMCVLAFWSFIQIFVFCDSSEFVAIHFDKIDIYQRNWYEFPARVRHANSYDEYSDTGRS